MGLSITGMNEMRFRILFTGEGRMNLMRPTFTGSAELEKRTPLLLSQRSDEARMNRSGPRDSAAIMSKKSVSSFSSGTRKSSMTVFYFPSLKP